MVPDSENRKNLVPCSMALIQGSPYSSIRSTKHSFFVEFYSPKRKREREVQDTDFSPAVPCDLMLVSDLLPTIWRTCTPVLTSQNLQHIQPALKLNLYTLAVITMFESSSTNHLFRVIWTIALAVICLASLAPLPRALASGPICEITSEQEQQIVDIHNWLRSTVRPSATNMRKLVSETPVNFSDTRLGLCCLYAVWNRYAWTTLHGGRGCFSLGRFELSTVTMLLPKPLPSQIQHNCRVA